MNFAFTLLLGSVVGVAIDRLYRHFFESALRVEIHPSCSFGQGGDRFLLHVTNVGNCQLPPYQVELFNPNRGSVSVFQPEEVSAIKN